MELHEFPSVVSCLSHSMLTCSLVLASEHTKKHTPVLVLQTGNKLSLFQLGLLTVEIASEIAVEWDWIWVLWLILVP